MENSLTPKNFYSNGKLLITGEYVVLDGALALALPTQYGQHLHIEQAEGQLIEWKSYDHDGSLWFEDNIPFSSIVRKERYAEPQHIKNTLVEILHEAYRMNATYITNSKGYRITTRLTFPKFWGLGTSSTLLNNLAQWLQIDAYELLRRSFGGSGYDVACAQYDKAITYQLQADKPAVRTVDFQPPFSDKIYFVYLNRKQSSKRAIASYMEKQGDLSETIEKINALTQKVIEAKDPSTFAAALQKHEIELSAVLEIQTVQEALFSDFEGVVKSLGAWGGDFVMAVSKENPTAYFKQRGYEIVIPYQQMVL